MKENQNPSLSDYQKATLAAIGIPVWQLRENGLAPVNQGQVLTSQSQDVIADTSDKVQVAAAEITPSAEQMQSDEVGVQPAPERLHVPLKETPAPVSIEGKLLITFNDINSPVVGDVLMALNWDTLPKHHAKEALAEQFSEAEACWLLGEQVKLVSGALTTPVPSDLDASQKRLLWQQISEHSIS